MKKIICITPVDETMRGWAEAVALLNEFRGLGFVKREVFIEAVINVDNSYTDHKKVQKLHAFWQVRDRTDELLNDLRNILETLKNQQQL